MLAIETATTQVGVAVGGHEGVRASVQVNRDRRHAELLAPAIEWCCQQAEVPLHELGAIAVDTGPGLFTGLRVGVTTAKTLASALQIPMVGVPSLDLVAFGVRFTQRQIVTVIDARRGEVFHARYRSVPGGVQRVDEYRVSTPEQLASDLSATKTDTLAVGDGALRYAEVLSDVQGVEVAEQGLAHPDVRALVQLAHARALREEFVPARELVPFYLRKPDVDQGGWVTNEGRTGPQPV